MNKYLLDTHVAIWFFNNDKALSDAADRVIGDLSNSLYVSIASIWELAIKISLKKMNFKGRVPGFVELLNANSISIIPIQTAYLPILDVLPSIHRDPFDRMLVATAMAEGLTLVTADRNIARYNVPLVW